VCLKNNYTNEDDEKGKEKLCVYISGFEGEIKNERKV
jgi:hypothetical protein